MNLAGTCEAVVSSNSRSYITCDIPSPPAREVGFCNKYVARNNVCAKHCPQIFTTTDP